MKEPTPRPDLLPCPFCGGIPESQPWHGGSETKVLISCSADRVAKCAAVPMVTGETPEQAERRWNTRHGVRPEQTRA